MGLLGFRLHSPHLLSFVGIRVGVPLNRETPQLSATTSKFRNTNILLRQYRRHANMTFLRLSVRAFVGDGEDHSSQQPQRDQDFSIGIYKMLRVYYKPV